MDEQTIEVCLNHFHNFLSVFWHFCLNFESAAFAVQTQCNNDEMAHLMNHDRFFLLKNYPSNGSPVFVYKKNVTDDGSQMFHFHMFGLNALSKNFPVDEDKLWKLFTIDPEIFYIVVGE